jgi:hypothetical protein
VSLFIEFPGWAALVGVALLALFWISRRTAVAVAGLAWVGYGAYEQAMKLRWLCTGECNIRVDLLLIYPVLLVITIVATVAFLRWLAHRRPVD